MPKPKSPICLPLTVSSCNGLIFVQLDDDVCRIKEFYITPEEAKVLVSALNWHIKRIEPRKRKQKKGKR